ncbi:MAG: hypothetical protein JWQ64_548 [Subtercola sp.]|nr:hypothetical protein [Subtercola sp.]
MQSTKLETRSLQTQPALTSLLPGGALKAGAAYSVEGSQALVMAMMAGPSAAGAWCGVVGLPDFGAEAAAHSGIDLERLVLIPHPGEQWLAVASAIIDVVTVVVMATPPRLSDAVAARLAARIRQREATLIVLGEWAQSEVTLRITESTWGGIGQGHGHLASRQVVVNSTGKGFMGHKRQARLWLPDAAEQIREVSEGVGQPAPAARDAGAARGAGVGAGVVLGAGAAPDAGAVRGAGAVRDAGAVRGMPAASEVTALPEFEREMLVG